MKAKHNVYNYARDTKRQEVEELYNLEADLGESKNLAAANPEIVAELKKLLGDITAGTYQPGN